MSARGLAHKLLPPFVLELAGGLRRRVETAVARRRLAGCDRLHLACGSNVLAGWGNICLAGPSEVVKFDLTRPFPVPPESVRFIFSEHFIEHIHQEEAALFLADCHRVLAPGGVIRISTPSLEGVVESYSAGDNGPDSPCRRINDRMRNWGHQYLYDRPELEAMLAASGFHGITAVVWRHSSHPELTGLECRPDHGEIILEAEK